MLDACLLGTGGMMPLPNRWLTSLMVRYNGDNILIDCGEGTQITLKEQGWGFKAIGCICFTHFHADHISGLPGLLLTIGNSGREEPVLLIGPQGLKTVVEGLLIIAPQLPFKVMCLELTEESETITFNGFAIEAFKVLHRITCYGYSIVVRRQGKFNVEKANALSIPVQYWSRLQKGETVDIDGQLVTPDMVLGDERKGLKISYCTDSRPLPVIVEHIQDADLFVCEGMYGTDEEQDNTKRYKHMTFEEAATLAKEGNVKELWLTHFSPALVNPEEELSVATNVFENTKTGQDRMTKIFKFEE